MKFAEIPMRENGRGVDADWLNTLRLAGILVEAFLGAGFRGKEDFAIANAQASPTSITGLSFDGATYRAVFIDYVVHRETDTESKAGGGTLKLIFNSATSTWELGDTGPGDHGCTFTADVAAGVAQVQYESDSMAGTYDTDASKISFTVRTIGV